MPTFCTLTVADVQRAAHWYDKTLNFKTIFSIHDQNTNEVSFVHLRREKYQDILLVKGQSDTKNNGLGIKLTFQAWRDVDALALQAKENGAHIVAEPQGTLWNTRDVTIQDLDGYRLTFTYPNQVMCQKIKPQLLNSEEWTAKKPYL